MEKESSWVACMRRCKVLIMDTCMSTQRNQKIPLAIALCIPSKRFSEWMSSEAPCCFALGPMETSTLLKKTQHSHQQQQIMQHATAIHPLYPHHRGQNVGNTNETQTFYSCPVRNPTNSLQEHRSGSNDHTGLTYEGGKPEMVTNG